MIYGFGLLWAAKGSYGNLDNVALQCYIRIPLGAAQVKGSLQSLLPFVAELVVFSGWVLSIVPGLL